MGRAVSGAEKALATLRDYVERSTHWQEGGADRHAALEALRALDQEACRVRGAEMEMTAALDYVDQIATKKDAEISYETMQRSGFNRSWRRKYSLSDARSAARCAAIRLRNAWQLLDPINVR